MYFEYAFSPQEGDSAAPAALPWNGGELGSVYWFCFGTLLGESLARGADLSRVVAAR